MNRVLYLVRFWKYEQYPLLSRKFDLQYYKTFVEYVLRYGKLRDLKWCRKRGELSCVTLFFPTHNVVREQIDPEYAYGSVEQLEGRVWSKGVFGFSDKSEYFRAFEEHRIIDMQPVHFSEIYPAFVQLLREKESLKNRLREFIEDLLKQT